MIRESHALPVMLKMIEWYKESVTARWVEGLFRWMTQVFESSLIYRLSSEDIFWGSKLLHRLPKASHPSKVGEWYQHSRFLFVAIGTEETIQTVFRHNHLFQFFLEDEAKYGD